MQHIAVEEILEEAGAEMHHEEGDDEGNDRHRDLRLPDGRGGEQPDEGDKARERDGDGEEKEGKRELLFDWCG